MENTLYPLRFVPHFKDKVWGGNRLKTLFGKDFDPLPNCGESWELSTVPGSISVVANGFLAGNELHDLIEVYMADLVGEKVYDKHGNKFPLLIKLLDTNDDLSIQVHPDDAVAQSRHLSPGKTEMWYVIHSEPGAEIIAGFNKDISREAYLKSLEDKKLKDILNVYKVKPGDVFYIPSGQVHAIGAGVTLCEIQQASDVTYRIYDWDRPGSDGRFRKLHTEEALDVIDFSERDNRVHYDIDQNAPSELVRSPYFTTRLLQFDKIFELDYYLVDSFVVYICLDGGFYIHYPGGKLKVSKGESVLLPALINSVTLEPEGSSRLLECYVP
jgi:mannose-6-phosphate isomerase